MSHHAVITGATGFIGASIASAMLGRGWKVTVLVRPHSSLERLATVSGHSVVTYSELDDVALRDRLGALKPDVFVHCAWRGVGGGERNEAFQILDNVPMTMTAVELAAAAGCVQWIGLGSQAEYGNLN